MDYWQRSMKGQRLEGTQARPLTNVLTQLRFPNCAWESQLAERLDRTSFQGPDGHSVKTWPPGRKYAAPICFGRDGETRPTCATGASRGLLSTQMRWI